MMRIRWSIARSTITTNRTRDRVTVTSAHAAVVTAAGTHIRTGGVTQD